LIPLAEGDYPHYQDQVWAEPDVAEATHYMTTLVDHPERGRLIALNLISGTRKPYKFQYDI